MGNYIHLDKIDFVRVHTAVLGHTGWLGEISTEITGAVDIPPDPGIVGETDMVVIKPAGPIIKTEDYQMHAMAFRKGKPLIDEDLIWFVNSVNATINNEGLLSVSESGNMKLAQACKAVPTLRLLQ